VPASTATARAVVGGSSRDSATRGSEGFEQRRLRYNRTQELAFDRDRAGPLDMFIHDASADVEQSAKLHA